MIRDEAIIRDTYQNHRSGIVFSEFSKSEFFLGFENSESAFLKIRIFDSKSLLSLPSITSNQCKQSILLSKRGEVCFEPNKTFKTSFFENSESAFWEFENSDFRVSGKPKLGFREKTRILQSLLLSFSLLKNTEIHDRILR